MEIRGKRMKTQVLFLIQRCSTHYDTCLHIWCFLSLTLSLSLSPFFLFLSFPFLLSNFCSSIDSRSLRCTLSSSKNFRKTLLFGSLFQSLSPPPLIHRKKNVCRVYKKWNVCLCRHLIPVSPGTNLREHWLFAAYCLFVFGVLSRWVFCMFRCDHLIVIVAISTLCVTRMPTNLYFAMHLSCTTQMNALSKESLLQAFACMLTFRTQKTISWTRGRSNRLGQRAQQHCNIEKMSGDRVRVNPW